MFKVPESEPLPDNDTPHTSCKCPCCPVMENFPTIVPEKKESSNDEYLGGGLRRDVKRSAQEEKRDDSIGGDLAKLCSSIVEDRGTQDLLQANGLRAHSVTWEDTARNKNSCWGPNISDMTLVVRDRDRLMPVIRKPNFSDVTDDVPIDTFELLVGNEKDGKEKKIVGLREYLQNIALYTDNTHDVDLTDKRDDVVITSSQCCVLPVHKGQKTEFALQLFNYQSYDDDPAVLVVLASKNGVSTQVLENSNTKLLFNHNGSAHWFTAERLQDKRERETGTSQKKVDSFKEMKEEEKMENVLMMIQVPLERKQRVTARGLYDFQEGSCDDFLECQSLPVCIAKTRGIGMDMGMIGVGMFEDKYVGTKNLTLKRDKRFPIRCTFQYYRVTDQDWISEADIRDIAEQVGQAAKVSLASGSLVISNKEPENKKKRVTEPDLNKQKPTDDPLGKLDKRDYLKQTGKTAADVWTASKQKLSGFM